MKTEKKQGGRVADTKVLHISGEEAFQKQVIESDKPVLVDFFAEWCGPCKMASPIMDSLSVEFDGDAFIAKIDVDDEANRAIAGNYGVMSIPTVVTMVNGEVVDKNIGFIGEDGYRGMIENALDEQGE